jgi:hypothetical protein
VPAVAERNLQAARPRSTFVGSHQILNRENQSRYSRNCETGSRLPTTNGNKTILCFQTSLHRLLREFWRTDPRRFYSKAAYIFVSQNQLAKAGFGRMFLTKRNTDYKHIAKGEQREGCIRKSAARPASLKTSVVSIEATVTDV